MHILHKAPYAVALQSCTSYAHKELSQSILESLQACGLLKHGGLLRPQSTVLVKPNLLRNHNLACTSPEVVKALCICLQDHGIKVIVADSPAFGSAKSVAENIGLSLALKPLGLKVQSFDMSKPISVEKDQCWPIANLALESDYIISVPRLKSHCQMGLTISIKNLFGCICGMHKAMAHARQGRNAEDFCKAILKLFDALPPTAALVDGVTAMHITGPSGGEPYQLGLIGASPSALAMDTALYHMLNAKEELTPLWKTAKQHGYPEALPQNIDYCLKKPQEFNTNDFILPQKLDDTSFLPHRLFTSLCKRIISRLTERI